MAAPILWAPGIFVFFLQENLHAHKIPRLGGWGVFWVRGGGEGIADIIFMGVRIFLSLQIASFLRRVFHACFYASFLPQTISEAKNGLR